VKNSCFCNGFGQLEIISPPQSLAAGLGIKPSSSFSGSP
jgi:hypothetical protein